TRLLVMGLMNAMWPEDEIQIGTDKGHHTFGKLIIKLDGGKSRVYDPWAGIQQMVRSVAAVATFDKDAGAAVGDAIRGRFHPFFMAFYSVGAGKDFIGRDIGRGEAALRSVTPISLEGLADAITEDTGVLDAIVATFLDVQGVSSYIVDTDSLPEK
ncbi:unnamed protein product, partial [marine sediment metagenome]